MLNPSELAQLEQRSLEQEILDALNATDQALSCKDILVRLKFPPDRETLSREVYRMKEGGIVSIVAEENRPGVPRKVATYRPAREVEITTQKKAAESAETTAPPSDKSIPQQVLDVIICEPGITPSALRTRFPANKKTQKAISNALNNLRVSKRIERHSRIWAAPQPVWIAALDEIIARRDEGKLTLPLKSHGYLLEIIAGQANKAEGKAEAEAEDRRAGKTPVGGVAQPRQEPSRPPPRREKPASSEAAQQAMRDAKKLVGLNQEKGAIP